MASRKAPVSFVSYNTAVIDHEHYKNNMNDYGFRGLLSVTIAGSVDARDTTRQPRIEHVYERCIPQETLL